jgi:hypothetical protein
MHEPHAGLLSDLERERGGLVVDDVGREAIPFGLRSHDCTDCLLGILSRDLFPSSPTTPTPTCTPRVLLNHQPSKARFRYGDSQRQGAADAHDEPAPK